MGATVSHRIELWQVATFAALVVLTAVSIAAMADNNLVEKPDWPGGEASGAPNEHPTCPACGAPVGSEHYWPDPFYFAEKVLGK